MAVLSNTALCLVVVLLSCLTSRSHTLELSGSHPFNLKSTTTTRQTQQVLGTLQDVIDLTNAQPLTMAMKREILKAASTMLKFVNPNLFFQRTFLKVNLPQQIKAVRDSLQTKYKTPFEFHVKMIEIFRSARDGLNLYEPPAVLRSATALPGFQVGRAYVNNQTEKFIVTNRFPFVEILDDSFVPGVTLLTMNGKPFRQVLLDLSADSYVNGEERSLTWALDFFASRSIMNVGPTVEPSANFTYIDLNGVTKEVNVNYVHLFEVPTNTTSRTAATEKIMKRKGFSLDGGLSPNLKTMDMEDASEEAFLLSTGVKQLGGAELQFQSILVNENFRNFFSVRNYTLGNLTFSRFRFTNIPLTSEVINPWATEMTRLLSLVDQERLIIDMRFARSGIPFAVLRGWELLSNQSLIAPRYPEQVRATALMEDILVARRLPSGVESVRTHRELGYRMSGPVYGVFSDGPAGQRTIPRAKQIYFGRKIILTSAITSAAGELFTSLFKDVSNDYVVGFSDTTYGSGGSTIFYSTLSDTFPDRFNTLPYGIDMVCPIIMFFRAGELDGSNVQYYGVQSDEIYRDTERDLFTGKSDMYAYLGQKLAQM